MWSISHLTCLDGSMDVSGVLCQPWDPAQAAAQDLIEMIDTAKMLLIIFRCQGLSHKTWKICILRKVLSWQQMFVTWPFVPLFAFPFADEPEHGFSHDGLCLSLNWIQKESEVGSGPAGLLLMRVFWCLQYPSWLPFSSCSFKGQCMCVVIDFFKSSFWFTVVLDEDKLPCTYILQSCAACPIIIVTNGEACFFVSDAPTSGFALGAVRFVDLYKFITPVYPHYSLLQDSLPPTTAVPTAPPFPHQTWQPLIFLSSS